MGNQFPFCVVGFSWGTIGCSASCVARVWVVCAWCVAHRGVGVP